MNTPLTQPLRVVQIGMGGWGSDWYKHVLSQNGDVDLVGFVDIEAAALAKAQATLALPTKSCFPSLEAALSAIACDAVVITAALPGHVPSALAALNAGKHVLMEKPFAPSVAEARRVVEMAKDCGRLLMISQNYRHYPAVRAVEALVRSGTLGPVGAVSIAFRMYANTAPRENHRHYTIRHPLLMDMSIHHFDLLRAILGQNARRITCHAWNPPWSKFLDPAAASATIIFDGGTVVTYEGNWVSTAPQTPWAGEWKIECELGTITWASRSMRGTNGDQVTVRMRSKRARRLELPNLAQIDRAGTLAAFVRAIRTGEEPETSGRDNLGSLALMEAAILSAEQGAPQPVEY